MFQNWKKVQQITSAVSLICWGLAPYTVFLASSLHFLFVLASLSPLLPYTLLFSPPPLPSAPVCVIWRSKCGGLMRKYLCWPTCSPHHADGVVCSSSGVWAFMFFPSLICLVGSSLLCRHTKWRGHSSSQWTRMTPPTTTELSKNQWVSEDVS